VAPLLVFGIIAAAAISWVYEMKKKADAKRSNNAVHVHGITRRLFLRCCAVFSVFAPQVLTGKFVLAKSSPSEKDTGMNSAITDMKIGLALGAGGANGLAHILMLEVFDELGIKPFQISGSSIGAVIGALYASGKSAKEIRKIADSLIIRQKDTLKDVLLNEKIFKWVDFLDPELGQGGLISGDAFLSFLYDKIKKATFEALEIPLSVVATDFWKREQVVYRSGELLPAIKGSMAIPGLFTPVSLDNRVLVDGGAVNPVPYDVLPDECDITIAIDVTGEKSPQKKLSFLNSIFNTFHIMQQAILNEKMIHQKPHIYIKPNIMNIRTLEFHKIDVIYKQARPAKAELKKRIRRMIS
jgi:NTE family protein